jgi:hypothetical protein
VGIPEHADHDSGTKPITYSEMKPITYSDLKLISLALRRNDGGGHLGTIPTERRTLDNKAS